jgi:hypothetical protein
MKQVFIALMAFVLARITGAADLDKLSVLYVGQPESSRGQQFSGFLRKNVGKIEVTAREGFKAAQAEGFDVVLLDWGQSERTADDWKAGRSPLGNRDQWEKPTVLLGSAGLNLAVVWKVRGGSG